MPIVGGLVPPCVVIILADWLQVPAGEPGAWDF